MFQILENIGKFGAKCECYICKSHYFVKNRYETRNSLRHLCNSCKYAISKANIITQEFLQKVFNYDLDSGKLTYKFTNSLGKCGEDASCKHNEGYLITRIGGKYYLTHRIIFMYMTGKFPKFIDHINHIRDDNRWCNLKEATILQNNKNTSLSKNSKTKCNGVSFHKQKNKFRAYIMINYKQIHLGLFETIEEAIEARNQANLKYNFHENHGK